MENYIVSARKYRPMTFDSVVGQHALTTTLKNAIATRKLAHAYLFCGPRGVGKTTCARIFAKTINCLNPSPQGDACNECESCKAFNEQRSFNIHELDAASNNSVEDIRTLIEQVRIPPQVGEYKVFIIDEVHMLSQAAFNAFLKTLEEPPHHAIFVLATTEKHKILPTILSRCQTYDFNRMNVNDTVEHLKFVAQKEGIEAEDEALNVIAQKADGGMRDALSIFDQVVSFTQGKVTYRSVIENLNVLDYEYYFKLTAHLLENKVPEAMLLLNEVLCKGFDGHHFITGFASHLRDLLVSRDTVTLPLLEVSDNIRARYAEQAKKCDVKFLYRAIKLCNDCDLNYRTSKNKRLLIELTLIQVAQLTTDDADAYCGRSPKKRLKPLFTQPAAADNTQAATKPNPQDKAPAVPAGNSGNTAANNNAAAADNNTTTVANGMTTAANGTTTVANGTATLSPDEIIARLKNRQAQNSNGIPGMRQNANRLREAPRLRITKPQPAPEQTKQVEEAPAVIENKPYDENDLRLHWLSFTNLMPRAETAMALRMKNLRPKIVGENTFEVVVNTNRFEKDLYQLKDRIEKYIRAEIHNSYVTMTVRVTEIATQKYVLSRPELYRAMAEKNPMLEKMRILFNLELD